MDEDPRKVINKESKYRPASHLQQQLLHQKQKEKEERGMGLTYAYKET